MKNSKNLALFILLSLFNFPLFSQNNDEINGSVLEKYLGTYQSLEAYFLEMPRFRSAEGPRNEIKILATNEFANDYHGSTEMEYYVYFTYNSDYSGQMAWGTNRYEGTAKIIKIKQIGSAIKLSLKAVGCTESSLDDESNHFNVSNTFEMQIENMENGKIKVSTLAAPSTCKAAWDLSNVILFPLLWSKQNHY